MRFHHFLLLGILLLPCCERKDRPKPAPQAAGPAEVSGTPVLKIAILRDGSVTANGKETSVPDLRTMLANYKAKNGAVWYYREGSKEKAPPVALEVLSAVLETKMPIRLSSLPDYSDSIGLVDPPVVGEGR